MKERIEYMDWARGYAIFTIVCYHALQRVELPAVLQQAIVFGGTGVHLFFLLSGFGLVLSDFSGSAVPFYKRRLFRVWLPYVLALTISWLAAAFFGFFSDGFGAWLAGVGLCQMFSERYIESFGGHFWFISAIFQFYLAFPILVWLKTKLGTRHFLSLALFVSVTWWLTVYFLGKGDSRVWNSCFLQFLWEFALGMTLAETFKIRNPKSTIRISGIWWLPLPIALLFTALMALMILKMGDAGRIFNDLPALIGYAAFSVFFFQVGEKFFLPLKWFFLWVGGFSYSLYLVHILVLEIWLRILGLAGIPVNGLSLLPFLALALLAGRLFEPLSRWWAGLFQKRTV
ncbi:MAG: hypothetical protein EPGJADBJ_03954 [Saprospiraceae bacterium]|nr:hypothetical protein [Saprospiraceae bacterium]